MKLFLVFIMCLACMLMRLPFTHSNRGKPCVDKERGTAGCCQLLSDCPSATQDLRLYHRRPTTCSFIKDAVVVCCSGPCDRQDSREDSYTWSTSSDSRDPVPSNFRTGVEKQRISEIKCNEYKNLRRGFATESNEVISFHETDLIHHIAGGVDAGIGEFPHMAAIGWYLGNSGNPQFLCGGSLISESYVLTASHCATKPLRHKQIEPSVVRLGAHNIFDNEEPGAFSVDMKIKKVTKHPSYKSPVKYHDIALIELAAKVRFTPNISPACLYPRNDYKNLKIAIVSGWGSTISGEEKNAPVLQKAVLNIISDDMCNRLWSRLHNRNFGSFMDHQICAGVLKGGIDTCQGDSGGPLQISVVNNMRQYYVIGVISFGKECAQPDLPGIYTIVPYFIDWIERIVWGDKY